MTTARHIGRLAAGMALAAGLGFGSGCVPEPENDWNPALSSVLRDFTLQVTELPPGYDLVRTPEVLRELGMDQNPGYIGNLSELEAMARRGGQMPFTALYGRTNETRLILNGNFFLSREHLVEFSEFQRTKKRHCAAFVRPVNGGAWLVLAASDPDREYSEREAEAVRRCLDRFRARAGLNLLWDDLAASSP